MKNQAKLFLISLLGIVMLSSADCNRHPVGPQIPVYSYLEPILNPPDTFQIVYNIRTYGNKTASVKFRNDAVWLVERLGSGVVTLKAVSDTSLQFIESVDTLTLKGGNQYHFIVNNNNYTGLSNFFVQFTKLPLNYSTFTPKFK